MNEKKKRKKNERTNGQLNDCMKERLIETKKHKSKADEGTNEEGTKE